jgi:hypothetical protein
MRKCKVRLGRLVLIDIDGEYAGKFDRTGREESFAMIAGAEADKEGKLTHLFYQPCVAAEVVESLKDDPLFEEEVMLEVYALDGKETKEKLYAFDGTLFDALLVAANEGEQYDV